MIPRGFSQFTFIPRCVPAMSSETSYDPYAMPDDAVEAAPVSLWSALKQIGPGIILAGSIVGSGELIATTSLGADWGFTFLWLILASCVIKVFVQVELGRYALSSGKPTLGFMNELPGPRLWVHWTVWWWFFMLLATVVQLGAMVGGVGQALNMAFPAVSPALVRWIGPETGLGTWLSAHPENPWGILTAFAAVALLLSGGYQMLERFTTVLVAGVTAVTTICVLLLPASGHPIPLDQVAAGLKGHVPEDPKALAAAFAAFGITGVGAAELFSYPYWCLEKGYARAVGRNSPDDSWVARAKGWMRVMQLDAWASMIVFTLATVSFYFLGATVLHPDPNLRPQGSKVIEVLSQMYEPAFGSWTKLVFLVGAWAVLFKTLYIASAGHARLTADFFSLTGLLSYPSPHYRARIIRGLCVFYPLLALTFYLFLGDAKAMVNFGGFVQGITLPVISGAAIYLRYFKTDPRIRPVWWWDLLLWVAVISLTVLAGWAAFDFARKLAMS
ncbi:MAG TPA: hypothetical protein DDY91_06045 [Planctomycetaceae bacterium]|nr:hypothetical protein [Planctomycetaceae bacterium]